MKTCSIKNEWLTVSVNTAGAELSSLKNAAGHELLWQADKAVWPRHAPVLFPIVGKLKNDTYTFNGKTYSLPQHGFARDQEFMIAGETESHLVFGLRENETSLKNYPFPFSLHIRYELSGKTLQITYNVRNTGNDILPFSIGAHPGFSCKLSAGESLCDFSIGFKDKKRLTVQKLSGGLLSGETYDLSLPDNTLRLSTALFDNDALVLKHMQVEELTLRSDKRTQALRMSCKGWPYFGIWTKKGSDDFVCLEPWYGVASAVEAGTELLKKEGILKLSPGEEFEAGFSLTLM